jgi:hypothetical protein
VHPSYVINGMVIKDDADSRARSPRKARDGRGDMLSLSTADIEGAKPSTWGSIKTGVIRLDERKDFTETNKLADIEGAAASTLAKGIRTLRNGAPTDPNERNYRLLDGAGMGADDLMVGHGWYVATTAALSAEAAGALPFTGTATAGGRARHAEGLPEEPSFSSGSSADALHGTLGGTAGSASSRGLPEPMTKLQWVQRRATALAAPPASVTTYPQDRPALRLAKKLIDPRDVEIARLRGQVEALGGTSSALGGTRAASFSATRTGSAGGAGREAADADAVSRLSHADDDSVGGAADGGLRSTGVAFANPSTTSATAGGFHDPKATARARLAMHRAQQASLSDSGGARLGQQTRVPPVDGEMTFSQMIANTIKSGPTAGGRGSSAGGAGATLGGSMRLTSGAGAAAGASLRHDAMHVRRQARDRESELSAVRSLPM